MKKLEEIPKIDVFKAPEGYFERLPGIVQARIQTPERALFWRPALRLAIPAMIVLIAVFLFRPQQSSPEELLASIDDTHLVAYLEENDLNTDELLEGVSIDNEDADAIQDQSMKDVDMLNSEEYLSNEFAEDYF